MRSSGLTRVQNIASVRTAENGSSASNPDRRRAPCFTPKISTETLHDTDLPDRPSTKARAALSPKL